MNEMLKTIVPKSDQLNADDLLGGRTITIKISKVHILAGEQPVALHYEGDNGRPYKPCKSMRRVIVTIWGPDANLYIGRCMAIYRDDKVTFGGGAVGGIRISHMSGISEDVTMALTASRASRKPYVVKPLEVPEGRLDLVVHGDEAAEQGLDALRAFWGRLSPAEKAQVGGAAQLESWKRTAGDGKPPHDPTTGEISDDKTGDEPMSDARATSLYDQERAKLEAKEPIK